MSTHKYTHTLEYYSSIKKEWNSTICSTMDGPRDYHTKQNKSEGERQTSYETTCMPNLKCSTNELIYEQKQTHRHIEETSGGQVCMHRDRMGVCK